MINKFPSNKTLREFGIIIGILFPLLIGFIFPYIAGHSFKFWTLWLSFSSIILSFTNTKLLYYPYKFWMKLGDILGWFNSRLILGLVFLIVLIPIAFVMNLLGHDPLGKNKEYKKTYRKFRQNRNIDLTKIF